MFRRAGFFAPVATLTATSSVAAVAFTHTPVACFSTTRPLLLSAHGQQQVLGLRREIATLWGRKLGSVSADAEAHLSRSADVRAVMDKYGLHPDAVARAAASLRKVQETEGDEAAAAEQQTEDYSRALGEHFDRLLLMLVPATKENIPYVERLMEVAAKNDLKINLKTIQHMFARTSTYAEALMLFHSMRKCRVAMSTEAYFAMIFCLQRLEEESWGKRYHEMMELSWQQQQEDAAATESASSSSAGEEGADSANKNPATTNIVDNAMMDFIINGCENQLMPESKPWLGKVLLENTEVGRSRSTEKDFDVAADMWVERYKNGEKQQAL